MTLKIWGDRRDSNPRQPVPQTGALPTELRSPYFWSGKRGSNSRHSAWKADALPTELFPQNGRNSKIRTCGPLLPRQMRYRTALYSDKYSIEHIEYYHKVFILSRIFLFFLDKFSKKKRISSFIPKFLCL